MKLIPGTLRFSRNYLLALATGTTFTALSPVYRTSGPSVAGLETTYTGGNGFSTSYNSQRWLNLYLSACKFLDLALALPSESLPQFQM